MDEPGDSRYAVDNRINRILMEVDDGGYFASHSSEKRLKEDVKFLVSELRKERERRERLETALRFYALDTNYGAEIRTRYGSVDIDRGKRARAALSDTDKEE